MSGKHSEAEKKHLFGRAIPPFGCPTPDNFSAKEMFSMYLRKAPGLAVEEGFPALGVGEPEQLLCCSLCEGVVTGGVIPVP